MQGSRRHVMWLSQSFFKLNVSHCSWISCSSCLHLSYFKLLDEPFTKGVSKAPKTLRYILKLCNQHQHMCIVIGIYYKALDFVLFAVCAQGHLKSILTALTLMDKELQLLQLDIPFLLCCRTWPIWRGTSICDKWLINFEAYHYSSVCRKQWRRLEPRPL